MILGTTPTHTFNITLDPAVIKSICIAYEQHGDVILRKDINDCAIKDSSIVVRLTQEETLRFNENGTVQIQVRVLTNGGDALASQIMRVPAYRVLDKAVLE